MSKKMSRKKMPTGSIPLVVPKVGLPPADPPTISLNPKRNFTLVASSAAASSGTFSVPQVAAALAKQVSTSAASALPLPTSEWPVTGVMWKNMIIRRIDAWGVSDSITYAPFSLKVGDAIAPHMPPPSAQSDIGAGSNSRPRASVLFPSNNWFTATTASSLGNLVTYTGVMRVHLHVTVW